MRNKKHEINGFYHTAILDLFVNQRKSTSEIAEKVGCTRIRISQILKKLGVNVNQMGRQIRKIRIEERVKSGNLEVTISPEDIHLQDIKYHEMKYSEMLDRWNKGQTISQIATAVGRPVSTVSTTIRRLRKRLGWFKPRYQRHKIQLFPVKIS